VRGSARFASLYPARFTLLSAALASWPRRNPWALQEDQPAIQRLMSPLAGMHGAVSIAGWFAPASILYDNAKVFVLGAPLPGPRPVSAPRLRWLPRIRAAPRPPCRRISRAFNYFLGGRRSRVAISTAPELPRIADEAAARS